MPRSPRFPAVTLGTILLSLIVYLLIGEHELTADPFGVHLARGWVYFNPWNIWSGGYWSLLTAVFVHVNPLPLVAPLHLAIDLVGLWVFGRRVEEVLGSTVLFALLFFGALVGSAANLAVGAGVGFGASGLVCALIGVMLALRRRHAPFAEMFLERVHARFVVSWLLLVMFAGMVGLIPIHNAAHLGGWLFGWLVGHAFLASRPRPWAFVGLTGLATLTLLAVTWLPWLPDWRLWRFQDELRAGRARDALARILPLLDDKPPMPEAINAVAWTLATAREDELRDGARAVDLARRACALTDWREASFIDTLAAAYAEAGLWDKALAIQRLALATAADRQYPAEFIEIFKNNLRNIIDRRKIRE
jgi:membrane associated rhomboid family serine protease